MATSKPGSRPRVCFISLHAYGYFDPDYGFTGGGAERQLSILARELADEFDVHVIVGDYGQPRVERRDGVTLHRAFAEDDVAGVDDKLRWLLGLARLLRRVDADVYVHRGSPSFAAVLFALCALLRKRWVYNLANDANVDSRPDSLGRVRRRLFERGLRNAAAVIAQSDYQAERLAERFGVDSTVVPNGYPDVDGDPVPHDEREFFLFVGRLDAAQKRPDRLLDLAERLPDDDFVVVGPPGTDDDYHDAFETRVGTLDNVEYVGTVAPDDVHDYVARALALVNTSAYEGFPNTFLEAWRAETPVVSLDVDPDRFTEEPVGGFADGNFERFVDIAADVADSVETRRRLGEGGRRTFERGFTVSAVAEQYGAVLRRAAE